MLLTFPLRVVGAAALWRSSKAVVVENSSSLTY